MRNALAIGFFLGIISAVAGSYLIVQQMSMMAGEIAHAVFPGIVLANFFGLNLLFGAFLSGLVSALLVGIITTRSRIKTDSAMALTLTSFLGLGILLIEILQTKEIDLSSILFGDILEVSTTDVWQTGLITIMILVITRIFYRELLFYTFNPEGAKAYGLPTELIYFGLLSAIAITIVISIKTIGILLVTALLIGPAITAYLLVNELHHMMILGSFIGVISIWFGMYFSYYLDVPSGAAIVIIIICVFSLALLFSKEAGVLKFWKKVTDIFKKMSPQINTDKHR
ncbi:MAG: metal ABC transporter permease [Xenococcaceae cyanobacterium]